MVDEMRKMRTAEEMFAYYCEHKDPKKKKGFFDTSLPVFDDERRGDFKLAEFFLEPDEYVISFFWGYIYIYIYDISADQNKRWIYIFTNKRIISICCEDYGVSSISYARLKNIIFIPSKIEIFFDIDGWCRGFSEVQAEKENLEFTQRELAEVLPYIREMHEKEMRKEKLIISPADEIRKFKELWDDGIITAEEFRQKKKKLLDL
jgi:hypothetical protein